MRAELKNQNAQLLTMKAMVEGMKSTLDAQTSLAAMFSRNCDRSIWSPEVMDTTDTATISINARLETQESHGTQIHSSSPFNNGNVWTKETAGSVPIEAKIGSDSNDSRTSQ
jgi:hypothetical protein